ncbi:hypothetical protein PVK06_042255 [Gossypium arboreum]|uniref:Uncharacterized protein n=1 Tax=Gossypium arboreum TaxID=29729 RepID=A0ABR0MKC6_GOSAR|nr:hypothetical protein PVK06_042255 [Gossypium arboreum]
MTAHHGISLAPRKSHQLAKGHLMGILQALLPQNLGSSLSQLVAWGNHPPLISSAHGSLSCFLLDASHKTLASQGPPSGNDRPKSLASSNPPSGMSCWHCSHNARS